METKGPDKVGEKGERTVPLFLGVITTIFLGMYNLHFSMGCWGPRVDGGFKDLLFSPHFFGGKCPF